MKRNFRTLAIAAASGRVGFILMRGNTPVDWGMSRKASSSPKALYKVMTQWIEKLQPDMIVSELAYSSTHKGARTHKLLEAANKQADEASCLNVTVIRKQQYGNKYIEAAALAKCYPTLEPWLPEKPPAWLPEPRAMIYFEALALIEAIKENK